MEKPQIILHAENPLNYTIFDTKWMPISTKFVALGTHTKGTGALQIYEISGGKVKLVSDITKTRGFKCGTFGASSLHQRFLATGDFEGHLQIWDMEKLDNPIYTTKAHSQIINAIDGVGGLGIGAGAPEIITGSRDGGVKVWDPRQKDLPVATMEAEPGQDKRDCWTVAFGNAYNNEERTICAGYDNGDIKLFDLKNMALRWENNLRNGVCCVEFDRKDIGMNKLVATTLESKFHVFDMRTYHNKKGYSSLIKKAHKSTVWLVRHLPQNRDIFMTTGGAGSLCLWNYEYPSKRCNEDGSSKVGVMGEVQLLQSNNICSQPISGFDWNPDKLGLAVCSSFDQKLRVIIATKLNTV
ncbi:dynein axonemal assembly factor 10-like [Uloborus diversus]|uniref:dynein axonemal assembly factor 10-like n=1 Tax=Uloborus diversus TaxID=327109 RepID=UPI002408FFA6|nr:dynein axonemal assembly factor 10-like [Uloborus diversus]